MNDLTLEQKLFLAGRLPELIHHEKDSVKTNFAWKHNDKQRDNFSGEMYLEHQLKYPISDREWLWVVAELEHKFLNHDVASYSNKRRKEYRNLLQVAVKSAGYSENYWGHATASQRTSALMKVMTDL